MSALEQMVRNTRQVVTAGGLEFEFVRPTLAVRMEVVDFVEAAQGLAGRVDEGDLEAVRALCQSFVGLLEKWLRRRYPEIGREEIAEAFDLADIPAVMGVINDFESELQAAVPPALGGPVR